ncbi:MAG: cytochrome c [Sulfuricella sp.]|nr:cytochrome c [Sulfuricella sp.]
MQTRIKAALCATLLSAIPLAAADSLVADSTVLLAGETFQMNYLTETPASQNIYVATVVDGNLLFLDENGGLVPYTAGQPTPARLKAPAAGSYKVISFTMPEGFYRNFTFYKATGKPGSDLLAAGNYDAASLRTLSVSFTAKPGTAGAAAVNGGALYAAHCSSCHNEDPTGNLGNILKGTDPLATTAAIKNPAGKMGHLAALTSDEITAIAAWISHPRFDCH